MSKQSSDRWKLGEAGAELQVAVYSVKLADQWLRIGGGLLAIFLAIAVQWQGTTQGVAPRNIASSYALTVSFFLGGVCAVLHGLLRKGFLRVDQQTLRAPRWILQLAQEQVFQLAELGAISERPAMYSDELSELIVFKSRSANKGAAQYLVPRSDVGELVQRLRLRAAASALNVPDAATMLELYSDPASKPFGVIYLDKQWHAFRSPKELADRAARHPYRERERLRVFMTEHDFKILSAAHPALPFERVSLDATLEVSEKRA